MKPFASLAIACLLAGCAATPPVPASLTRDWRIERGQWQQLADGTLHGSCLAPDTTALDASCRGDQMAVLRSQRRLPQHYRVQADIVVRQGILAELMLSWHAERFSRFVLYGLEKRAYAGKGWMRLPTIDRGEPSLVQAGFMLRPGQRYRVAVNVCRQQLTAWVDGQPLLRHSDPSLGGGVLGLRANGSVAFSRVQVRALDPFNCPRDFAADDFMRDAEDAPAPALPFCFSC